MSVSLRNGLEKVLVSLRNRLLWRLTDVFSSLLQRLTDTFSSPLRRLTAYFEVKDGKNEIFSFILFREVKFFIYHF